MHIDITMSLEVNADGTVSGTWQKSPTKQPSVSASTFCISTKTLILVKDSFMAKDYVRLSRGINVMIDASREPKRVGHAYFSRHLQTTTYTVSLDRLEKVVSRGDFEANFLETRGGGPALLKVVVKHIPQIRKLLA
jgi:hypothetical protein